MPAWWHNREENQFAWKVPLEQIRANNYNLDIKNPYQLNPEYTDLDQMLAEHQRQLADLQIVRSKLKFELMAALGGEIDGVQ